MKRGMTGGSYRGPVALIRQRRAIRFVQALLVALGAGLMMYSGYSLGRSSAGTAAGWNALAPAPAPSMTQVVVLGLLGLLAFAAALVLQGRGGVRIPTPARLEELAGGGPVVEAEETRQNASQEKSREKRQVQ
jgi:hypothetical protein